MDEATRTRRVSMCGTVAQSGMFGLTDSGAGGRIYKEARNEHTQ